MVVGLSVAWVRVIVERYVVGVPSFVVVMVLISVVGITVVSVRVNVLKSVVSFPSRVVTIVLIRVVENRSVRVSRSVAVKRRLSV